MGALLILTALVFGIMPAAIDAQPPQLAPSGQPMRSADSLDKTISKMSASSFQALLANGGKAPAKVATGGGSPEYAVLNIEFRNAASRRVVFSDLKKSTIPNAFVLTVVDKFADVFVGTDQAWNAIEVNPNVVRAEYSTTITPPPPPGGTAAPFKTQGIPESIIRGGYKGLTGKNVNIAILDTGIDFRHPDFITKDAKGLAVSRLKYLWDTSLEYQPGRGSPAPFKYPNGASIGTLFTRAQLTAELNSKSINIPPTDEDGHGTACASIAAGNGNADRLANGLKRPIVNGVAPDADLIGVRMGPGDSFENSYLLGAIAEWLDKAAGLQPLVVSGSFGGHYTAHDGQTVAERQMDARFPLTKASRAIVFAAGNEGDSPIHAKASFTGDAKLVTWSACPTYTENGVPTRCDSAFLNVYFNGNDANYSIVGTALTAITKDNSHWELNPITNQYHAWIKVGPGDGAVWVKTGAGGAGEADLYFSSWRQGMFKSDSVAYSNLVGTPGTMGNAITVGSYDWNDNFHVGGRVINETDSCGYGKALEIGWLSCYSSPGPRRAAAGTQQVKPEIVSPGEYYAAANARINGAPAGWGNEPGYTDTTGYYRKMNGTSAATPYTAGVIALFFQKRPTLTLGRLRDLLKSDASTTALNPSPAGTPNGKWGYGKLDLAAIDRILIDLDKQR